MNETERINRQFEGKYFPKVVKAIQARVDEISKVVSESGVQAGMNAASTMVSNVALSNSVRDLYLEVGLRFARRTWKDLENQRRQARTKSIQIETKGFGFNETWTEFIKRFLFQFLIEKITFRVDETTRQVLLNILQQSITEGWGVDKTVRELDNLPFTRMQAARIVRTEINRAANTGAMAAGETFEFEQQKEWISAHDSRTRGNPMNGIKDHANHWSLDGTTVDYEDVFIDPRNGDQLRYPGDPLASAESTINCRCTVAVIAKRDGNGRLIPKRKTTAVIYPNRRRQTIVTI